MKLSWTTDSIRYSKSDAVAFPASPTLELVGFTSTVVSQIVGDNLQAHLEHLKKETFPFGHSLLVPSFREGRDLILSIIRKLSSHYKFTRTSEASLFSVYINSLCIANRLKVKHLALPIFTLEGLNFPEKESMLCALYGIFSYFLLNPDTTVEEITVHFPDSTSLARFAALLPACDSELILEDVLSISNQRQRLIDVFGPDGPKVIVFEKNNVSFGSFVKQYSSKHEKRTIVKLITSLILPTVVQESNTNSDFTSNRGSKNKKRMQKIREDADFRLAENELLKKRRADPTIREMENSAQKQRREDPAVREQLNCATRLSQRLRRTDPKVKEKENLDRRQRRSDPTIKELTNSAQKQRREVPEIRERENRLMREKQRLRRMNPEIREEENATRRERLQHSEMREQTNSARKRRREDPEVRFRHNSAMKERQRVRRSDSDHRMQETQKKKQRRENEELREKENKNRQQRRSVPEIRQNESLLERVRYRLNPLNRAKKWIRNLFRNAKLSRENNTFPEKFRSVIPMSNGHQKQGRRLFPSNSAQQESAILDKRFAELKRRAQISLKAKKVVLKRKARKMHRTCRSKNRVPQIVTQMPSTFLSEERKRTFLMNLRRPLNAAYSSSLRLPFHTSVLSKENNNELIKIIVAQLVLRPRNVLTKDFVNSIVKESREIYADGSEMLRQLTVKLRKEQAYLRKAMEHTSKDLTQDQIIGGLRIHVKSCDRQRMKSYVPLEKLFHTPGEIPGLHPEASLRRSADEVEDILVNVDQSEEVIVCDVLDQLINRVAMDNPVPNRIQEGTFQFSVAETDDSLIIRQLLDDLVTRISSQNTPNQTLADLKDQTYGALCDDNCVLPDCDWSFLIPYKLERICDPGKSARVLLQELSSITYCRFCEEEDCPKVAYCENIKHLLAELAPHCQNIRTIVRRFYEIKRISTWIYKWESAVASSDLVALFDLVKLHGYLGKAPASDTDNFQSENYVNNKFSKLMEKCRQKMSNHEIFPCFSCTILCSKDKVKKISSSLNIAAPIIKGLAKVPSELIICDSCHKSLKKGCVPVLYTGNGLEIPFLPEDLQNLNWLETLLIRKVRPLMATFLLAPLRGTGQNQMKGFKGSVLHLPVEIEKSINHVIRHLPSAEGFDIIVNTTPKKVVQKLLTVDMDKVIRALLWLKANNDQYKDIDIRATFNPVEDLIEKTLSGDPNLEATQRERNLSGDPNLEATQAELEQLRLLPQDEPQEDTEGRLLSFVTEHLALTNIDPPNPDPLPSKKLFELNQMDGAPVNALEQDLDVKVFPELFPTGKFGMHHKREIPVSETLFLRRNLRSRYSRFRQNLSYIFFQANRKDIKTIMGSASIMVKKLTGTTSIFDRIAQKDSSIDDLLSTMFTNVRSHQEYWANVKRELRTKITYFGPPTFFITLNPAEYEWTELRQYYKALYPHMKKTIGEFVEMDPLIFARHFTKRVSAITTEMIYRNNGIFGEVTHHFWRMEYQRRGAPHVHMLVWVKDAPKIGKDSNETVAAFIDKHISCAKRDPAVEPTLAHLVKRFQVHRQPCSDTCKIVRKIGKKRITSCRFLYPQEPSVETVVLSEEERQEMNSLLRMKKGYLLKRTPEEIFINAYNCALLIIWRGNIDIQMISSILLKYVDYVTSYVGKSESKNLLDGIDLSRSKCSVKDLVGFAIKFMKNREMGAAEAVDRCLGHKLHHSDTDVMWLHTNAKNERMRRLKTSKEMAVTEDGGSETADNFIDVYYPNRSAFLEQFSLFNIFMNYKAVSKLPDKVKECRTEIPDIESTNVFFDDGWETRDKESPFYQHPANLAYPIRGTKKWLVSRTKPILPRMYWPNCDDGPDEQECWSRRVLLAFKPWRDEESLNDGAPTFFDAYHIFMETITPIAKTQVNRLLNAADDLTAALLEKKKDYEEIAKIRKELGISEAEALEIQAVTATPEEVAAGEQRLNAGQRQLYDRIVKAAESEDAKRKDNTREHTSLCMFVSGVGGTGKTALILQLLAKIALMYSIDSRTKEEPAVLLSAPTGLAALAIRGNTLHSLLQLGTDKSSGMKYQKLGNVKQSELAVLFRNCRLLIVDEISMVSNVMLFKICLRLTEIRNNNEAFGGINLVVFGDLLQLPPVRARDVFERLSAKEVKRVFHSLALNYPLWDRFEYGELVENMRQKEDQSFAELLGRIRIGSPTEVDIKVLLKRMISLQFESEPLPEHHAPRSATMDEAARFFVGKLTKKEEIVALFSKVDTVNEFNETVHKLLGFEVEEIQAVDVIQQRITRKKGQRSRPYQQVGFRRKDWGRSKKSLTNILKRKRKEGLIEGTQGGLPDRLRIAVNSRVMLRRNLDVAIGLVNGAMGVVKEIISDHKNRVINIMVKFDNLEDVVPIEKITVPFDVSGEIFATRIQFPLLVAYAVTIHKAQGMTTRNVLANIEDAFAKGMAYVALSRATSLSGVHLIGFNPKKINASESALCEYKRLRDKIKMSPLPEGNVLPQLRLNFHSSKNRKKRTAPTSVCHPERELQESLLTTETNTLSKTMTAKRTRGVSKARGDVKNLIAYNATSETSIEREDTTTTQQLQVADQNTLRLNQSRMFLWLSNRGSDCFVNAVVWSMLCSTIGRRIARDDEANLICRSFWQLRSSELGIVQTTAQLRGLFPQFLLDGDHHQHDAADFYKELIANLPDTIMKQMTVKKTTTVTCTGCLQDNDRERHTRIVAAETCMYSEEFSGIVEQMTSTAIVHAPCSTCNEMMRHLQTVSFDAEETRFIALEFGWADEGVPVRNRPAIVEMFDETWKLVAAVEYKTGRTYGVTGHYIAWVNCDDIWYTLDDQEEEEFEHESFKADHSGIKLMFFEKVF